MFYNSQKQGGYSLIEVLVAAAISSVVLIGVTSMLRDFTKAFIKAERQNVLAMLRTRVINEIARKDAWVVTYNNNASFGCLFLTPADPTCGTGDTRFVVYNSQTRVVLNATAATPTNGFTKTGINCPSAVEPATYPSLNCPIRLEVHWRLKNIGDNPSLNSGYIQNYFPTNVMPYGYAPASYFPSWSVTSNGYGFFGTITAQVEVTGTFFVHSGVAAGQSQSENFANQVQPEKYGFKLLKEVP